MKTFIVHFRETGGYKIITDFSRLAVNAEATKRRVAEEVDLAPYRGLPPEAYKKKTEEIFYEKAVYLNPGPNTLAVTDGEGLVLEEKKKALGAHECLTVEGIVIPDFRDTKYWYRENGEWKSARIEAVGVGLPKGAHEAGKIPEEAGKAIAEQEEANRVRDLPPEEKDKEKAAALEAAKAQARIRKEEAEIAGEAFDAPAWFREKKAEIENKYA
jgi:hypothetical protein